MVPPRLLRTFGRVLQVVQSCHLFLSYYFLRRVSQAASIAMLSTLNFPSPFFVFVRRRIDLLPFDGFGLGVFWRGLVS